MIRKGKENCIPKIIAASAGIFLLYAPLFLLDLDDRLFQLVAEHLTPGTVKARSIWLPNYRAVIEGKAIAGVECNASGITYSHETGTLFIILNGPTQIVETDLRGNALRIIDLAGFEDTEAICHMGGHRFAVVEERKSRITVIRIDEETRSITRNAQPGVTLALSAAGNKGFEGIAWNGNARRFTVVKERSPLAIYEIRLPSGDGSSPPSLEVTRPPGIDPEALYLKDLSGLHFHEATGNLLMISDESRLLAEVDPQGKQVSFLELSKGFSGLTADVPQAEGVAMDGAGTIFVISEPNLFYAFRKPVPLPNS